MTIRKLLGITRDWRLYKMAYENSEIKYSWFGNIIREKESKGIKQEHVSPQIIRDDNLYGKHLSDWLTTLEEDFKEAKADQQYLDIINEFKTGIVDILGKYHEGNIGEAYERMKIIISNLIEEPADLAVSAIQNSFAFNNVKDVLDGSVKNIQIEFFRARVSDKYCVFDRNEMLHIPFDMRGRVSSTRFSIPGLPCLYLATTSYCCWLELRTPADHQFNVSPVRVNEKNRILNLTMSADMFEYIIEITGAEKSANKHTIEALKLWILSYASSFKIKSDNRSFKEEYIIPQLIMLVSRDLGLDGVSYYSKQVEDDRFAHMLCVNLALFAKYNGEKRFSKICKDIEIAPSYNYAMFKQLGHSEKYKSTSVELHSNGGNSRMIGNFDRQNEYQSTEFYNFDRYLFSHIAREIKKVDIDKENE